MHSRQRGSLSHDSVGAMSNLPFSQRLGAFKQRFQQVLGNRGSGYDELAQLEQPLVGDDSSYGGGNDYERSHGVSAPGQLGYGSGMGGGGGGGGMSANSALPSHVNQTIPSQVSDSLGQQLHANPHRQQSVLAKRIIQTHIPYLLPNLCNCLNCNRSEHPQCFVNLKGLKLCVARATGPCKLLLCICDNGIYVLSAQGDELQLLAGLASDAAGLLWELAAMHDTGDAATDMLAKSEQLQVCILHMLA